VISHTNAPANNPKANAPTTQRIALTLFVGGIASRIPIASPIVKEKMQAYRLATKWSLKAKPAQNNSNKTNGITGARAANAPMAAAKNEAQIRISIACNRLCPE